MVRCCESLSRVLAFSYSVHIMHVCLLVKFYPRYSFCPCRTNPIIHRLCGCPRGLPAQNVAATARCMHHSKSWKQIQACEAGVHRMTAAFWSSCSAWGPYPTPSKTAQRWARVFKEALGVSKHPRATPVCTARGFEDGFSKVGKLCNYKVARCTPRSLFFPIG